MWWELYIYLKNSTLENNINEGIFWFLLGIFVIALAFHWLKFFSKFVSIAPILLTGIGILGTFLGIFLGLYQFDVNDIKGSVENLLDGLKIAFVTSILGMASAIILRLAMLVIDGVKLIFVRDEKSPKTAEDFMLMVQDIRDTIKESAEKNDTNFNKIAESIGGNSDSSLVNIIGKVRTDANDNHKEMKKEFREFADKVTESSSKALIEALEEVVRNFNEKITEQFGDNFKQLNAAVGALLEWQKEYKQHLETMQERLKQYIDSIQAVDVAVDSIKENTASIPASLEKLSLIIKSADDELAKLHDGLKTFAEMKDQALEAFPVLEENLRKISDALDAHVGTLNKTLEAQQANHKDIQNAFSGLSDQAKEVTQEFTNSMRESMQIQQAELKSMAEQLGTNMQVQQAELKSMAENLSEGVRESMQAQQSELKNMIGQFSEQLEKEINKSTREMQENIRQGVEKSIADLKSRFGVLDKEIEQQLKKVIEEMGGHLASLSKEFVKDYRPLTDQLSELLRNYAIVADLLKKQSERENNEAE